MRGMADRENSQPHRDPNAVLLALKAACLAHPDQRVTQVIVNALGEDPFYVENEKAAAKLADYAMFGRAA
jgi:hypothetical protein